MSRDGYAVILGGTLGRRKLGCKIPFVNCVEGDSSNFTVGVVHVR